jgi:hypothetical protein
VGLRRFAGARGQTLTLTGPSRNTKGYLRLLEAVEIEANPIGDIYLIADNPSLAIRVLLP